ncbi:hypothetical protein GFGA_1d1293 [Gluconobacter frateurii NBRC 103465]|nr:hypothetical protein GFGA_1d1293 [Gluconobacter frateurii NBRC 103465]
MLRVDLIYNAIYDGDMYGWPACVGRLKPALLLDSRS